MAHQKYSKSQYQRDLEDGIVTYDKATIEQIEKIPTSKHDPKKRGRKANTFSPNFIRTHHVDLFNAAYERYLKSN